MYNIADKISGKAYGTESIYSRTVRTGSTFTVTDIGGLVIVANKIPNTFTVSTTLQGTAPATAGNYGIFFIADKRYTVTGVNAVWSTASSSGTLNVERLQGTEASDGGDFLLSSAISTAGTANTVTAGALTGTAAWLTLEAGNRLGLVDGGTLTSCAQLTVTVQLKYDPA